MIGAAPSALAMANTVASTPAAASDAAAQADAAAPQMAGQTTRGAPASRPTGPTKDLQETETSGQAFAELLTPPPASAPPRADVAAERGSAGSNEVAASPEQLLAMLDGAWSGALGADPGTAQALPVMPPVPAARSGMVASAAERPGASGASLHGIGAASDAGVEALRGLGGAPGALGEALPLTAEAAPAAVRPGTGGAGGTTHGAGPGLDIDPSAVGLSSAGAAAEPALPPAAEVAAASALVAATAATVGVTDTANGTQPGFAVDAPAAAPPSGTRMQTAPALPMPPMPMPADPGEGFDEGFGTRLVWMAEHRMGHAEIRLNPEHVGPIGVRVQLDGDQVRAEFHSAHAEVRQAIEASLPRLREMLGQHGLQLGQADVGQGQARRDGSGPGSAGTRDGDAAADSGAALQDPPLAIRTRGLLDAYA